MALKKEGLRQFIANHFNQCMTSYKYETLKNLQAS